MVVKVYLQLCEEYLLTKRCLCAKVLHQLVKLLLTLLPNILCDASTTRKGYAVIFATNGSQHYLAICQCQSAHMFVGVEFIKWWLYFGLNHHWHSPPRIRTTPQVWIRPEFRMVWRWMVAAVPWLRNYDKSLCHPIELPVGLSCQNPLCHLLELHEVVVGHEGTCKVSASIVPSACSVYHPRQNHAPT